MCRKSKLAATPGGAVPACSALEFRAAFFGHEQVRDLELDSCGHSRPPKFGQRRATFGTSYLATFKTQHEAIESSGHHGHTPLVARVRHLNDQKKPDHWRSP
jgi:hypothetical protein